MDDKELFLLDAYALIYRAYYALIRSPQFTTTGINTSAIYGFCNTLDEILRKENPTHIAVCFDPKGGETFRHEVYPDYKANRDAQPEGITVAIPYIKRILEAYNIPMIERREYEADDIIGTLSRQAEREGFLTYMMTPDKDYGQLVTDRVLMYRPSLRGQDFAIRGPKEVCEKYKIKEPRQVIDLLALEGDKIDNIPGCPGIGEVTAQKLIERFGSVENMLEHVNELKGAQRRNVEENADKIRFSKFLATIRTDVPLDIDLESLRRKPENVEELMKVFKELEFKTLVKRLQASASKNEEGKNSHSAPRLAAGEGSSNSQPSLFDFDNSVETPDVPVETLADDQCVAVTTLEEVATLVERASKLENVGFSVWPSSDEPMKATLKAVAFAIPDDKSYFIELPTESTAREEFKTAITPLLTAPSVRLVAHEIKPMLIVLRREQMPMDSNYGDTAVAHYLLQPEMKHTLSNVAKAYLNYETVDYTDTARDRRTPDQWTREEARVRVGEQAAVAIKLQSTLLNLLKEQGLDKLYREIELPVIPVLAEMEYTGVRIDPRDLHELSRQLTERLHSMEREVYNLAGGEFNLGSPSQVGEVLFERLKIDSKAKRTKKGAYSTTEDILEKYAATHPIVELILKIRRLRKLLATYINALPELINPVTGKIHTTYNQTVTATGRISSTNPNLQNIPIRTDDGREIRRAFIADPGCLILSADYSQIELRLMADLSHDPQMIEAFRCGADFHQATAAKIYHRELNEVTANERRNAKTANFGIIYGISAFGLSERLGISRAEAKALIDGYFTTYEGVKRYMEESIQRAREDGYVTTLFGRKRYLPEINSRNAVVRGYAERNAINAPLQGSAADIIKRAMIDIHAYIRDHGLRSRMIMQVHDELIFNVVPEELDELRAVVINKMEDAYTRGAVPLEVSAGVGENWLEAH
ncbi:MAG: DNA polymerase I [Bacteroidales bacterium]|nr:DNA polymerase I [Bacteroidales bacterium]